MGGPRPQLVALLLCEQAFQQAVTSNWCIIGTFDTLSAPQLPFTHPGFTAFVALADFVGDAVVQLVVRDEDGAVVKAVRGKVPEIPLGLFQCAFPLPEVEFKNAGVHTLELFAGDQLVTLRSFRVLADAPADPAAEQARARELCEQHKAKLIDDALEVWAQHPEARPVGLIAAPDAGQSIAFRQGFESVFGAPPPSMPFVGLIDHPTATKLLHQRPAEQEWLEPPPAEGARVLPIVIAMRGGFQIVHETIDRPT